jgi:methylmalonyl-CoA mutase N-terminal domain/subunit
VARLGELRSGRDQAELDSALARLEETARNGGNVVEPMLACVRAQGTLFEIRHALERVYGAFKEPVFF